MIIMMRRIIIIIILIIMIIRHYEGGFYVKKFTRHITRIHFKREEKEWGGPFLLLIQE